jgi:N-acetylglucosamine-6-sulfatase
MEKKRGITRRTALQGLSAAAAGALVTGGRARRVGAAGQGRPNFIFILTDDQRWDALGCAGHPFFKSPNLDRLAREGVRFKNAFVTTSLCSPSRATFLTGLYAHRHGVMNNFTPWTGEHLTFLERLARIGYDCAFIGKWHMPGKGLPRLQGVDPFISFTAVAGQGKYFDCPLIINGKEVKTSGYITDQLTGYALDFLKQPRRNPFCLYLAHKAAHSPMSPAPRHQGLYREATVTLPPELKFKGHEAHYNLMHLLVMGKNTPAGWSRQIQDYYATLQAVDEGVGRILDYLDQAGLAENTAIFFAGDNGFFWGEHGLIDKRYAYEESLRIPLLARFPAGIEKPGREIPELALNLDLAPSLLDLAGVEIPAEMQGLSWKPLLRGERTDWRQSFLYEYFKDWPFPVPPMLAVRTPEWKFIHYLEAKPEDELFHLAEDPKEMTNLLKDPSSANTLASLRSELERLKQGTGYPSP